jgi:hypothetical protein
MNKENRLVCGTECAAAIADLAGECGCVYGAEWSRALRLADDAAESVICTEGHSPAA